MPRLARGETWHGLKRRYSEATDPLDLGHDHGVALLSDNGVKQQIKVTVPAGTGVTKHFVHLKVTRP